MSGAAGRSLCPGPPVASQLASIHTVDTLLLDGIDVELPLRSSQ